MFQAEVLGLVAKSREFEALQLRLQEKETRAAEAAARTEQLTTMLHAAEQVSLRALLVQNYLLY